MGNRGWRLRLALGTALAVTTAGTSGAAVQQALAPTWIGLLGHSEGAAIAVMAAVGSSDVAFVVMLAGAGLTGDRVLELQTEAIARTSGASEAQIASVVSVNRAVYAIVREDKDVQVVAMPNLDAIRSALERAGHKEHTVVALPGLNHLLQECKTGAITQYSTIEQTMAPQAFEMVGDWILARAKGSR